jgi:GTP diphosphokinase / guanosine-3',5'-bis(diphosphate) 3'-diphosphatase
MDDFQEYGDAAHTPVPQPAPVQKDEQDQVIGNAMDEFSEEDRRLIVAKYRELLRSFNHELQEDDRRLLRNAFEMAAEAHKEQRRKSGEHYLFHPIEVARICVKEIGLGATAAAIALVHDVVEDSSLPIEAISERFPDPVPQGAKHKPKPGSHKPEEPKPLSRIARMVDGLTKLEKLHENEHEQAQNILKVVRAMCEDVRVVLVKMADRLHNMRTIGSMKAEKQLKIAIETEEIYTPLAHKLGLYNIKTEFQDLTLKVRNPDAFQEVKDKLSVSKTKREAFIESFIKPIKADLDDMGIKARVFGRPKSIYSIWNKMKAKKVAFEDLYDKFAIRIVIDTSGLSSEREEKMLCWQAYALVIDRYQPVPERHKDWISQPKQNGYQSIHTTVVHKDTELDSNDTTAQYVEVQIRTEKMDEIAERGYAAHWKYKGVKAGNDHFDTWLQDLRQTLDGKGNPIDLLRAFSSRLFVENAIHVFTPKGDMKILPEGSTGLDLAFSIHSVLGCTCSAIKVNGALQPFSYKLNNGDQVEIITQKNQKPSEDWLHYVATGRARERIRQAINEDKRKVAEEGKAILDRKLDRKFKVTAEDNADMLAKYFGFNNRLEFLYAVNLQQVDLKLLQHFKADGKYLIPIEPVNRSEADTAKVDTPKPQLRNKSYSDVIINGEPGIHYAYALATCCNPVFGDTIFAYLSSKKEGASVHRTSCSNANFLYSNYSMRILPAEWGNVVREKSSAFIYITGVDVGQGTIRRLTERLEQLHISMESFSIAAEAGRFECKANLLVTSAEHLRLAMVALKQFEFVGEVWRVEANDISGD